MLGCLSVVEQSVNSLFVNVSLAVYLNRYLDLEFSLVFLIFEVIEQLTTLKLINVVEVFLTLLIIEEPQSDFEFVSIPHDLDQVSEEVHQHLSYFKFIAVDLLEAFKATLFFNF